MYSDKRLILILIAFLVLAVLQAIYFYPKLPDKIATHYGADGVPDGYSDKTKALIFDIALLVFMSGVFFGLSWMMKKVPDNLINIPNKDFWLKSENKPLTVKIISSFGLKVGIVTELFLLMLFQRIYSINISGSRLNSTNFWFGLLVYFVAIGFLVWQFYQFFQSKERINRFQR
ncbi:MAG: DUF1648 domain-containing protein [Calditrichaeota bacterium]|nr:DUF1648 domain-containing protein [Calditrichota bacterium]